VLSAAGMDFGSVLIGASLKESLEVSNSGISILDVYSISILTGGQGFVITEVRDNVGTPIITGGYACTIAIGEKITIDVEFTPTSTAVHLDTLRISHNGINVGSPLFV